MAPALEALGRRIEDVRWILLTHGHIDHVGGAHALWELTGRRAQVVIHEADAPLLRSRRAHVDEYLAGRAQYLHDPDGEAKQTAAANAVISGEMEPTLLVRGGETLSLGGDVTVSVHSIPGHTRRIRRLRRRRTERRVRRRRRAGPRRGQRLPRLRGPGRLPREPAVPARRGPPAAPLPRAPVPPRGRRALRRRARRASRPGRRCRGASRSRPASTTPPAAACADGLQETDSPYSPFARVAEDLGYAGRPHASSRPRSSPRCTATARRSTT